MAAGRTLLPRRTTYVHFEKEDGKPDPEYVEPVVVCTEGDVNKKEHQRTFPCSTPPADVYIKATDVFRKSINRAPSPQQKEI